MDSCAGGQARGPSIREKAPSGQVPYLFFALYQVSVTSPLEVGECRDWARESPSGAHTRAASQCRKSRTVLSLKHLCSWSMLCVSWPRLPNRNQTGERIPLFSMQRLLSGSSSQDVNGRFKYDKATLTGSLLLATATPILTHPMGQWWAPVYRKGIKAPKGEVPHSEKSVELKSQTV